MPKTGENTDYADRIASLADRHREAWQRTLDDAEELAAKREDNGWETLIIPAGHSAPEHTEAGESDRYGIAHVLPGNKADEFEERTDADFDSYDVYRAEAEGRVFLVTELLDADNELAVFIVGSFELRHADKLIEESMEEGKTFTHLQRLDGTPVAVVEHENPEKFFPHVDRFLDQ